MRQILENFLRKVNFKGKRRLINFLFKEHRYKGVAFLNGYSLKIDTKFSIDWEIYWMGGYEQESISLLDQFIHKNFVCIDVGANIGVYTIPLSQKACKVIAFEPYFQSLLKENIVLNKANNILVREVFLSDKEGEADLFTSAVPSTNNTRTIVPMFSGIVKEARVKVSTLDKEIRVKVDFIKIDTDGADPNIILGSKNLIEKHHPIILFEICGSRTEEYENVLNRAIEYLKKQKYSLSLISNKGHLTPFFFPVVGCETNVLALPAK
ncbi:MAG TPA: FkbM family methyltransferase [Candidatus Jorgensenbacteria bacterium]|nr:FkbM family methyltransferase [Candidatus Jorgensenbacteria bacterium]